MIDWNEIKFIRKGYLKALYWVKDNMYDNLGEIEAKMLDDNIDKMTKAIKDSEVKN